MREKMPPTVERLVRLMLLLPNDHHHKLHRRIMNESPDAVNLRWFVGDAARMWPPAGPRNLATAVLTVFANPSQELLVLLSEAIVSESIGDITGPEVGAAWVERVRAAAIDVLAFDRPLEEIHAEAREHWSLRG